MAVEDKNNRLKRDAAAKLWRAGILSWKLDKDEHGKLVPAAPQAKIDAEFNAIAKEGRRLIILGARGLGKTFWELIKLIEGALQRPNTHYAFVTKSKVQAKGNIRQSVEDILADCPQDVRPRFLKNDARFEFQNGSTLQLLGVDSERFESLRGRAFHGIVLDEAQSIDQLDTIVKAVLGPCADRVRGWFVISGTVPENANHEFVHYIEEASIDGRCIIKDIYQSRYTPGQIEQFKENSGGDDSDIWQREFLCKLKFSATRRVLPEWTLEVAQHLVREHPRPQYCDLYTGLDFAYSRDLTVALFGYVDFSKATLVIEDELALKPSTTAVMAAALERKETELWGPADSRPTVSRWADGNELRTIHELNTVHRLSYRATDKKAKQMAISGVRTLITEGRLVISPKCKLLAKTLLGAQWDKNHKLFDRDTVIGHADALDALIYLSRNVNWHHNPIPKPTHWIDGKPIVRTESEGVQNVRKALTGVSTQSLREKVQQRLGRRRKF